MQGISSTRGGKKLVYQGFICVEQKNLAKIVESYEYEIWRNLKQCKARIRVSGDPSSRSVRRPQLMHQILEAHY